MQLIVMRTWGIIRRLFGYSKLMIEVLFHTCDFAIPRFQTPEKRKKSNLCYPVTRFRYQITSELFRRGQLLEPYLCMMIVNQMSLCLIFHRLTRKWHYSLKFVENIGFGSSFPKKNNVFVQSPFSPHPTNGETKRKNKYIF